MPYNGNSVNSDSSLSANSTPAEETVTLNSNSEGPSPNNDLKQPKNTPSSSVSAPSESAETSKKPSTPPRACGACKSQVPPASTFHPEAHLFFLPPLNSVHNHNSRANGSNEHPQVQVKIKEQNLNMNFLPSESLALALEALITGIFSQVTSNRNPEQVSPPAAAGQQQASQSSTAPADNQQPAAASVSDAKSASNTISSLLSDAITTPAQSTLSKS